MATSKRFPIHYDKTSVVSNPGERYETVYSSYYNEDGILVVEPSSFSSLFSISGISSALSTEILSIFAEVFPIFIPF